MGYEAAYAALFCVGAAGWWLSRFYRAMKDEHRRVLDREERATRERDASRRTAAGSAP